MAYYDEGTLFSRTTNKFFFYGYEDPYASFRSQLLEKKNGQPVALSMIMNEYNLDFAAREPATGLRPVYINGVELGFSLPTVDGDTTQDILNRSNRVVRVRAITNTLWFFLVRGHTAQALVPYCFRKFPDKCDNYEELMLLHRLRLVEFITGYGEEKYVEVNRILAKRARDNGSCIVARSRLQTIIAEMPYMEAFLGNRVLIPTFNGNDIMFPVDGPLGRAGDDLINSLVSRPHAEDYEVVMTLQLTLREQCYLLETIAEYTAISKWIELSRRCMQLLPVEERNFQVFNEPLQLMGIGFMSSDNPNMEPLGDRVSGVRIMMHFDDVTGKFSWRYKDPEPELQTATEAEFTDEDERLVAPKRRKVFRKGKRHPRSQVVSAADSDEAYWADESDNVSVIGLLTCNRLHKLPHRRKTRSAHLNDGDDDGDDYGSDVADEHSFFSNVLR